MLMNIHIYRNKSNNGKRQLTATHTRTRWRMCECILRLHASLITDKAFRPKLRPNLALNLWETKMHRIKFIFCW